MVSALSDGAQSDAKSSAGDKHETALSMMHIEQEKINLKLAECHDLLVVLKRLDPDDASPHVVRGSLVDTGGPVLYVSAALPKCQIAGRTVIPLSPQSPLGASLMGKTEGFAFFIGSTGYTIRAVL